jgi:hypothetical protein
MRLQINNARGYQYRRYAALTKIATAAWTVFASMLFFTQPDVADFFLAVAVAAFGIVPGLMFATMFDDIASAEFEAMVQPLLGVVRPDLDKFTNDQG